MNKLEGLRLMYVDDEHSALVNCKAAVDSLPDIASAIFFQSPQDALVHVKENPIDIALLDIDIPEMNGFELAERLQSEVESIKIIFVTGNIHYMRPANRPIKVPYVFKPYADYEIADALEQATFGA